MSDPCKPPHGTHPDHHLIYMRRKNNQNGSLWNGAGSRKKQEKESLHLISVKKKLHYQSSMNVFEGRESWKGITRKENKSHPDKGRTLLPKS